MSPLRRWVVLALLLLMGVPCIAALVATRSRASATVPIGAHRPPGPRSIQSLDTVIVFPVTKYQGYSTTSWLIYDNDAFNADTVAGRRYQVEIVNGSPSVTGLIFIVNGQQFVGSSEMSTVARRIIDVQPGSNSMEVWVKGSSSSYVNLRVTRVNDPTFSVFPAPPWPDPAPKTYVRPTPIAAQNDTFLWTTGDNVADLRIINGLPDGSHRINNAMLSINGSTVLNSWDWSTGKATINTQVTLVTTGGGINTLSLTNSSASGTQASIKLRIRDTTAPVITWALPADSFVTASLKVGVRDTVKDEIAGTVNVNGRPPFATPGSFTDSLPTATDGKYTLTVTALNSASLQTAVSRTVYRDTQAPTLSVARPAADTTVTDSLIAFIGSWSDLTKSYVTVDGDTVQNFPWFSGGFTRTVLMDLGPNVILCRAVDALGHTTEVRRTVFRQTAGETAPAAPSPSALSPTGVTPFRSGVRFLYAGNPQVQLGADTTKFDSMLMSVVRGRVVGRDFGPIANVAVRVLGHSEYGTTVTRSDGQFNLVVNGGAQLTFRFTKLGYLEVQRSVLPPPNDFLSLDDVAVIGGSARMTTVTNSGTQFARGRFATDANGDRDIRMMFPQGVKAKITSAAGHVDSFTTMHVRAKEFTTGGDGPKSMPGVLPSGSAYTYCVDLRLAEADNLTPQDSVSLGSAFTKPIPCYVKNFLHFPVGAAIPTGYYDPVAGQWKPGPDGVVIKILSLSANGDTTRIDSKGTGTPDDSTRLAQLGVTGEERVGLKSQYAVGDTLWRMSVTHFSTWDFNPNPTALRTLLSNAGGSAGKPQQLFSCGRLPLTIKRGSIIECENRVLGEEIPIVGTAYSLNYRSLRASGDSAIRTVRIPVIGATVPDSLLKIIVRLDVAGQVIQKELNKTIPANSVVSIAWNGLDAFGRTVQGSVTAKLAVGYQYALGYASAVGGQSFADPSASGPAMAPTTGNRSIGRTVWNRETISLGAASTGSDGLGGWTLSPHHFYDFSGQGAVYLGDGSIILGEQMRPTASIYAGEGTCNTNNVEVAVTASPAPSFSAAALALGPDLSLYVADNCRGAILRIDRAGVIHLVAGHQVPGDYTGDTLIAPTSASFRSFTGLALGQDGAIYFAIDGAGVNNHAILKLAADGMLHKLVGGKSADPTGSGGDGGPAGLAWIGEPTALALGPDGSLYVGDYGNGQRVRRIAPGGLITTYAGRPGSAGPGNDSTGLASKIGLTDIRALTTDSDGNLYIVESQNFRVRKVAPDGTITTIVNNGWSNGGGYPELRPKNIALAPDGSLYISSVGGQDQPGLAKVWRRDLDGGVGVIAGGGLTFSNGMPAAAAALAPDAIVVAPDGSYYVGSYAFAANGGYIYRVARTLGTTSGNEVAIPSPDGSEVFYFDASSGRHLRTRDALTGAVRYHFRYDSVGRLLSIRDFSGDSTIIQRNGSGTPTGIVGPFGHSTALTVDGTTGDLLTVSDPTSQTNTLTYWAGGLLHTLRDPQGNTHSFTFESDGRLKTDADPNPPGGVQNIAMVPSGITRTVTLTSGESRTTTFTITDQYDGTRQRSIVDPAGLMSYMSDSTDAQIHGWDPDGTITVDSLGPNRRPGFGMVAPVPSRSSATLPLSHTRHLVDVSRNPDAAFVMPYPLGKLIEGVKVNSRSDSFYTEFDATAKTLATRTPEGRTSTTMVDTAGRPLSIAIPTLTTVTLSYDGRGRATLIQQGARAWHYAYGSNGLIATITDPLNRSTSFVYDNADRLTQETLPGSRQIQFGYDANGNLTSLTPPGGHAHAFDITPVDQTDRYRPPSAGLSAYLTQYRYNKDHQLFRIERPDSANVRIDYDHVKARPTAIVIPRGTSAITYSDTSGYVKTLSSPDGVTLTYGYDGPLVTYEAWSGNVAGSVAHTYDADFRVATQSVNNGTPLTLGYDHDGLLTSIGSLVIHRLTDTGAVDSTTLLNCTTRQDYSGFGELANLRYDAGANEKFLQSLARDNLGRITESDETVLGAVTTKAYAYSTPDTGFLKTVTTNGSVTERYGYDGNGNRTRFEGAGTDTASATYDDQDRMLRYKDTRYAYSAAGELMKVKTGADSTLYTYDPLGSLVTVILSTGDRIDYLIDGRNRRVGRKFNGTLQKQWLYQDQLEPVAELDGSGALVSRFVYGTRSNVPDYMIKSGVTYRIIADHLGSVRLVIDASADTVAENMTYDGYGRLTADTSPGFQPFGYAGGLWDAATGLVRFGARDYDARTGRWTSKDPIGFAAGDVPLYGYVSADPIDATDAPGLWTIGAGGTGGGSFAGWGVNGTLTINVGHDPSAGAFSGWSASLAATGSGGASGGYGVGLGYLGQWTNARDVSGLDGRFYEAGRGALGARGLGGLGYEQSPDGRVRGILVTVSDPRLTWPKGSYIGPIGGASETRSLKWIQARPCPAVSRRGQIK